MFQRLLGAAAALGLAAAAHAIPPGPQDLERLTRLAADNDAAWDAANASLISSQYSEDATLRVAGMAETAIGRAAIRAYFERSFASRPGGLRHVTQLERVDIAGPDLAFADAHVRVERLEGGQWQLVRRFRNHSLLRRDAGSWRLYAVRAHRID